jgi:DNA-binding CsgD family transcriptional regulator
MGNERELFGLVGQLYEAATDADCAANLCALMAPHFGTESSIIHTCTESSLEMRSILSATQNMDSWAWSAYDAHYHDRNIWFQRGIRKGPSVVVICEELVPEPELLRSEWYDYCYKLDWFHCLGIGVSIDKDLVGGIGFHRPRFGKPYDEADRRKARFILPHIERALQVQHRIGALANEREVALDVIAGLGVGVIIVATSGRLLFANCVAERALQDGRVLSIRKGQLRSRDPRQQQTLERMIGEAAQTSAGQGLGTGGVLRLSINGRALNLLVSPLRSATMGYGTGVPAAVLVFSDPDQPSDVSEETLGAAFQLTKAQARLLAAILRGQNLREYAASAGISINTAKTLMQQIFEKTGCGRQTDLIRMIAADPMFRLAGSRGARQSD